MRHSQPTFMSVLFLELLKKSITVSPEYEISCLCKQNHNGPVIIYMILYVALDCCVGCVTLHAGIHSVKWATPD